MNHLRFAHRTALITGAGGGIGRAASLRFATEGARLLLVDANVAAAAETARQVLEATGAAAASIQLDIADPESIALLPGLITQQTDTVDVLVNSAGISSRVPFFELTVEQWDTVMNVNLRGTFQVSQVVGRMMANQGSGAIVNLASVNSTVVRHPDHSVYTASKAGVVGLTKAMAVSLADYGIRVNAVAPGPVDTQLLAARSAEPGAGPSPLRGVLRRRLGRADDVAAAIAFLASDEADFITGTTLDVDGGILTGAEVRPQSPES